VEIMTFFSSNLNQTANIAALVASRLKGGEVILLNGDIGAGKTAFAKALALALGVNENVTSPTFTIIKQYAGRFNFYHIDMYRINETEAQNLGIHELLSDKNAVVAIEWNKLNQIVNKKITVNITADQNNQRTFEINEQHNY
jgi:tRNA threonylcarbamoyladenosine biosynthesis protein TsaE